MFEGVTKKPVAFAPVRGFQPQIHKGLSLELGGPWAFYREFWKPTISKTWLNCSRTRSCDQVRKHAEHTISNSQSNRVAAMLQ